MKASLSLLLLLSALGTAMADVSTENRALLFSDNFNVISASQDGVGKRWNYIDYVGWDKVVNEDEEDEEDKVKDRKWRTYQSNDTALSEIRTEGDTNFVSLWGKKGDYHTENTSTSNNNKVEGTEVYACGGLFTNKTFTFQYGYVEARARFDCVQGCWPAIWMLPANNGTGWPDNGEIDILEHLNSETIAYQTLHFFANDGVKDAAAGLQGTITGELTGWHTYGMEWTEKAITFYVDGTKTGTISGDAYTNWPFDRENNEFYLMIDQQIGGKWVEGAKGIDDDTLSNKGAALDIDYIRVYSAETPEAAATHIWDNGGSSEWSGGAQLAGGGTWLNGTNITFSGTKKTLEVGKNVLSPRVTITDGAQLVLNGGSVRATELVLEGNAEATTLVPRTSLTINGELEVGTLTTAANKWYSTVQLTVANGGNAAIDSVQGKAVNGTIGQVYLSAQGSGVLSIGSLNNAGGVVLINDAAADTGHVSITGDAQFYQLFLSGGELELHSDRITMNNGGKIELKGGTLLWDGDLNDSKLVYNGGAVKLTNEPVGDITLTGTQKLEMTAPTACVTLEGNSVLRTTGNWEYDKTSDISGSGTLEIGAGALTINRVLNDTDSIGHIHVKDGATADFRFQAANGNGAYNGTVIVDAGGTLKVTGDTLDGGRVLVVGDNGTILNNGEVLIDSTNTGTGIKRINGMAGNGKVTAEASNVLVKQSAAGFCGSLEVKNGGKMTFQNATSLDTLDAVLGTISLEGSKTISAKELHLSENGTLTAVNGTTEATLTISGLVNAANGAHLNADLVLASGAVFNVSDSGAAGSGLIMGSSITLTDRVELGSDVVHTLTNVADSCVLASSMDGFYTDGVIFSWADGETRSAADYFTLSDADEDKLNLSNYSLSYTGTTGDGVLTLSLTAPEPATATLSLLALAALAARRRR